MEYRDTRALAPTTAIESDITSVDLEHGPVEVGRLGKGHVASWTTRQYESAQHSSLYWKYSPTVTVDPSERSLRSNVVSASTVNEAIVMSVQDATTESTSPSDEIVHDARGTLSDEASGASKRGAMKNMMSKETKLAK